MNMRFAHCPIRTSRVQQSTLMAARDLKSMMNNLYWSSSHRQRDAQEIQFCPLYFGFVQAS